MAFSKVGWTRLAARRGRRLDIAVGKACAPVAESLERRTLLSLAFAPQVTYPVSAPPTDVVVADFDGDGKLDIATVNSDGTVNILRGKGNGTFRAAHSVPDGLGVTTGTDSKLNVADFNGYSDLVVSDYTQQVSVLLGNGDGTFQTPHIYSLTSDVTSLAIGDVNGDGNPDVVLGESNGDVAISLGNGDGTFQPPTLLQVDSCAINGIAVADFNHDSKPDIVTGARDGAIDLLLGDGDGTFQAPKTIYNTATYNFGFAALDVNGDGNPDVVIGKDAGTLVTLLGNGNGTFKVSAPSAVIGNLDNGTGADVNGDGKPDAILADATTGQVEVALGNGDGTFKAPVLYSVGNVPASVVVADLTGNGKNDIVTANYGSSSVSVLINQSTDLNFTRPPVISIPNEPRSVTAAALTSNGVNDLIVTNEIDNTVEIFMGNGDGTFKQGVTYSVADDPTAAVVGDLGNGHQDIVVASAGYQMISVLLGNGDGTFKAAVETDIGVNISPNAQSMALADVNGDGRDDLIIANGGYGTFSVMLGNGDGSFKHHKTFDLYGTDVSESTYATAEAIAVGDFNGHLDVVVTDTSYGDNFVDIFLGNGSGSFPAPTHYSTGNYPSSIAIGDVNGDGNPDIAIANKYDASVSILLGNSGGTFAAPVSVPAHNYPQAVAIADVNGDGHPDIITTNTSPSGYGAGHVNILLGNGDGTFVAPQAYSVGNYARTLAVADLNGDGKPDIVTGNGSSYSLSILLNNNSGIVMMSGGVVEATGTNASTSASVTYSGGEVTLSLDGQSETFTESMVKAIDINLGSGNDTIMITSGVESVDVDGGGGSDLLMAENTAVDTIGGDGGADTIMGGGKGSMLTGNGGSDMLVSNNRHDTVIGGGGNDTVSGDGHDSLSGGAGNNIFLDAGMKKDTINGGSGLNFAQNNTTDSMSNIYEVFDPSAPVETDVAVAALAADVSDDLLGGPLDATDAVTASVVDGELKVTGTAGPDIISVSLNTAGTKLRVTGNSVDVGSFSLAGLTGIHINGGAGADSISIDTSVTLPATVLGNGGADTLVGGGGDNVLTGGPGGDSLVGGAGTNLLVPDQNTSFVDGPAGNDTLDGGTGFSIADFSRRTDALTLSNDGVADSGGAGEKSDIMSNVSVIWGGTAADTITGATAGEFLSGGDGANSVHGGGANDLLVGGGGNDTVIVAAEPVSLYLINGSPNEYGGVNNPSEDILQLDSLDTEIS